MSRCLHPCPSCTRHLRAGEDRCPFCDALLPAGFGACASAAPASGAGGRVLSRAALVFLGATATGGCIATGPVPMYGPGPVLDSGSPSEGGPDASPDAQGDASPDAGEE